MNRSATLWGILLSILLFGANLSRMAPSISTGDSAELSAAQSTLGIAHSPGYPLFVLAGKPFSLLVPFGDPSYRTNLLSVALSALCGWILYILLVRWTASIFLSFCAAGTILSVPIIRQQFLTTEVFALNTFLLLWILRVLTDAVKNGSDFSHAGHKDFDPDPSIQRNMRSFSLASFVLGLGLGNQHTLILLIPAFVFAWILLFRPFRRNGKDWFRYFSAPSIFFVLGLSIYMFLPIRSFQDPFLDWEDPESPERFWAVFSRARYGMLQLAQGPASEISLSNFMKKAEFLFREVYSHLNWMGSLVCVGGTVLALSRKQFRKIALFLILILIFTGPFFFMFSNVSAEGGYGIISRFFPMPFMIFLILGVIGFSHLRMDGALGGLFLVLLLIWVQSESLRRNFFLYDYGKNILRTIPKNAILFSDRADEAEFSLAYFFSVRSRRKDLRFVDCNAGVTRSIYGNDYYGIWGEPRLAIRTLKEKQMIQNTADPVYYSTVDPQMIPIHRSQEGMVFRAKPSGTSSIAWNEFYTLRLDLLNLNYRETSLLCSYGNITGAHLLESGLFRASENFFKLCSLFNPNGGWNHRIALLYFKKGDFGRAEKFFLNAVGREPEQDKILNNLGILYERQGRLGLAEDAYRKAIHLKPRSLQPTYNLGVLYWKKRRWKDVIAQFEKVLEFDPNHTEAKRLLKFAKKRRVESSN